MPAYQTIETVFSDKCCTIWLAREEKRNAINGTMVDEMLDCLSRLEADEAVRVVLIRGRGACFCAGGDLRWMGGADDKPLAEHPASRLTLLFSSLYRFPKPLVISLHGAALGGALGLIACADIVVAHEDTTLSFTELKLGLIPAVISPFVIQKIGEFRARKLILRSQVLHAREAQSFDLVDTVLPGHEIEDYLEALCAEMLLLAPKATAACKKMIVQVAGQPLDDNLFQYTAAQLQSIQKKREAKEGISAFLEKRHPDWAVE